MNLRDTIPSQKEIEEFLGRDYFPKYPHPQNVKETVDMVQLHFEVPDAARNLPCPRGHGTDGTVLECLTLFAIQRLVEIGFLMHVMTSTYQVKSGVKYFGKQPIKDVNHCVYRLREMAKVNVPVEQGMAILTRTWNEETVLVAAFKVALTNKQLVLA